MPRPTAVARHRVSISASDGTPLQVARSGLERNLDGVLRWHEDRQPFLHAAPVIAPNLVFVLERNMSDFMPNRLRACQQRFRPVRFARYNALELAAASESLCLAP